MSAGLITAREQAVITAVQRPQPPMGWALRKLRRTAKKHSNEVLDCIQNIYIKGKVSGQKAESCDIAKDLKTYRDSTGKKVFKPHEWLNADTISGMFSRFTTQDTMDGSK